MRKLYRLGFAAAICFASATSAVAQDHSAFIQGFGGVRINSGMLGRAGGFGMMSSRSFGGVVGGDLTPNIQAIGEFGRIGNVLPGMVQSILSFTPYDVRVSAWYGQGGVRLTTGSSSTIQPYVETLAGMSRLHAGVAGFGAANPYVNAALGFLTTTRPIASLGGGVVFQSGAVMLDAGYRFNRIFAGNSLVDAFTGGDIDGNQVRVGIGVRF